VTLQKALGKSLAGFKHRRGARGAKDAEAALLQGVDNPERERKLRPDDGEIGTLSFGQAHHGVKVFQVERNAARNLRHAAVAGSADDFCHARAALDSPGKRMFAPAGAKDENFH
jgi:hypothetical protein